MGFASTYLKERALFPQKIEEAVDKRTGIIVVVPAYNETGITRMLDSLSHCLEPECGIEVIIVINAPDDATSECLENNRLTFNNIESWKRKNVNTFFRLFALMIDHPSIQRWGVGLARKTGMDEAVRRFNSINKPEGVILCLDADCTVEQNYFISVYNELAENTDRSACSIYFEHPLAGNDHSQSTYKYIILYELHLRYFYQGLIFAGFPYVFHTVGSSLAVKALPYVKAGGMNRKQAGEDFYFIQKLVPAGGYFSLNSTIVYPSSRASGRVPFGTGASIEKLCRDGSLTVLTYNFLAFKELRTFFKQTDLFFELSLPLLKEHFNQIPETIRRFLDEEEWIEKIREVNANTSGIQSFRKRYYGWFNMFRIVKYLNFVHMDLLDKQAVDISADNLLHHKGIILDSKTPLDLLKYYRKMERPAI